jgi:hypothetical protein
MKLRDIENDDSEGIASSVIADAPKFFKLLKISKLLKMLKLLRVVKVKRLMAKFEEYIITDSVDLLVTFFNIVVKIIVIAHYMGCAFFYIGMDELRNNNNGWLVANDLLDVPFRTKYITSMYWAFTTMIAVGYGDITPTTKDETRYVMIAMITSCGIFAFTVNSIS